MVCSITDPTYSVMRTGNGQIIITVPGFHIVDYAFYLIDCSVEIRRGFHRAWISSGFKSLMVWFQHRKMENVMKTQLLKGGRESNAGC